MQLTHEYLTLIPAVISAVLLVGCASQNASPSGSQSASVGVITRQRFGQMSDGTPVELFTLTNSKGAEAQICNYGGIVISLKVPDKNGQMGDVVLGYDNLAGYLKESPYFGAIVGRVGNRIANAKFTLDGKEYTLPVNNGPNCLHGGIKGFDKVVWRPQLVSLSMGPALALHYLSRDGEEGFPGNLAVTAVYSLTEDNALRLDFTATTDKDTVVNLTQHTYFNLAGKGNILNHEVTIPADKFTPVDSTLIPTGELRRVEGTPFDFRKPMAIGVRIGQDDEQLKFGSGYDHNFVINKPLGKLGLVGRAYDPVSGRVLEVISTGPGVQFYTGNHLSGTITGKGGWTYQRRDGFCMEAQHFPDSPNHPNFPSIVLKPGQTYTNTIIFKFSVQ
jgi:aldose 1-epimerase